MKICYFVDFKFKLYIMILLTLIKFSEHDDFIEPFFYTIVVRVFDVGKKNYNLQPRSRNIT